MTKAFIPDPDLNPDSTESLEQRANEIERLAHEGKQPAVDPDLADYMGAFEEEALYPTDALDSLSDVDADGLVIMGEDLPTDDHTEGEIE